MGYPTIIYQVGVDAYQLLQRTFAPQRRQKDSRTLLKCYVSWKTMGCVVGVVNGRG